MTRLLMQAMKSRFRHSFVFSEPQGVLREAIRGQGISKRALTDIKFKGGQLLVNGVEESVRKVLTRGDVVEIIFPAEVRSKGLLPVHKQLDIVYEDEHLLVIDKPNNLPSIPSRDHPLDSLANRVAGYFEAENIDTTVHMVTRLDRETSGLVLLAKHRHAHHLVSEQMREGKITKSYRAIVEGELPGTEGIIEAPIGRVNSSIIERCIDPGGKYAKTGYRSITRWIVQERVHHLVDVTLFTGRTHQIRVHMASLGCPLAGDDLYGGHADFMERQALHAARLELIHPFEKQPLIFESRLPDDFLLLLERR